MAEISGNLILRPVASKGTITTTTPADTAIEDCYKLVNEEISDDAATCIHIGANETIYFKLSNINISSITSITNAELHIYGNDGFTSGTQEIDFAVTKYSDESVDAIGIGLEGESDTFESTIVNINNLDNFSSIIDLILSDDIGIYFCNTGDKATPVISQIYLVVYCTYSISDNIESSLSFYTKQNGIWQLSTGTLYKKQDGIWNKTELSSIEGNQFNIEVATYIPPLSYMFNSDSTYAVNGIGGCTDTDIIIPEKYKRCLVTTINSNAFKGCSDLNSIIIPNNVTSIYSSPFSGCSSLESITIPFIGHNLVAATDTSNIYGFGYIFGTTEYTGSYSASKVVHDSIYESSRTGDSYYIPTSLRSVTVNGGIIFHLAFYMCDSLTNVTIGSGVTEVSISAFSGCNNLTSLTYNGTIEQWNTIILNETVGAGNITTINCTDGIITI